ncbi:MAG: sigma-70 family RNA polymerase sigma factor [Rhodothermales bacterium]
MLSSSDVTRLLRAYGEGHQKALDQLFPVVYEHLKRIAHNRLREERPGHTLNTTGLVHEAYLKLVDIKQVRYEDRGHFFAMASRVMRRLLINYAEQRRAQKRGGGARKETLDEARLLPDDYAETLLELDDALHQMDKAYPRSAQAIAHRYFGGLMNDEIAEALRVSTKTVQRDLRFGRAWLAHQWRGSLQLS